MALIILKECISCDACLPVCPTEAISVSDPIYVINSKLCTECIGFYKKPNCIDVCPIDCIEIDSNFIESKEDLLKKRKSLNSYLTVGK